MTSRCGAGKRASASATSARSPARSATSPPGAAGAEAASSAGTNVSLRRRTARTRSIARVRARVTIHASGVPRAGLDRAPRADPSSRGRLVSRDLPVARARAGRGAAVTVRWRARLRHGDLLSAPIGRAFGAAPDQIGRSLASLRRRRGHGLAARGARRRARDTTGPWWRAAGRGAGRRLVWRACRGWRRVRADGRHGRARLRLRRLRACGPRDAARRLAGSARDHRGTDMTNLFDDVPRELPAERIDVLLETPTLRLERIVSTGHATPPGEWYDADRDEWVVVLRGRARLRIEGEAADRALGVGDHLLLRAHVRHRVEWTETPTVWLALHYPPGAHSAG